MSTKEENTAAVLETPGARLSIIARPIPTPSQGEILVRNHAIAANPADWKMQDMGVYIQRYPAVLGVDNAGIVAAIGPDVTRFKIGDRVAGYAGAIYSGNADHGSWQTYTVLREVSTVRIPDALTFEEASTLPVAIATAGVALFMDLGIPRPIGAVAQQQEQSSSILIWGGASSIGTGAIQLARNAGLTVFATASPNHHEYLKSLGASRLFDYRDPNVVSKIVAAAKDVGTPLRLGFDAITEGNTSKRSSDILLASGGKGGRLALSLGWPSDDEKPDGIEIIPSIAFHHATKQPEFGNWLFNDYLAQELEKKTLVPAPRIQLVEGGLGAAQKAFDLSKAGVSATKLVVKLD